MQSSFMINRADYEIYLFLYFDLDNKDLPKHRINTLLIIYWTYAINPNVKYFSKHNLPYLDFPSNVLLNRHAIVRQTERTHAIDDRN